MAGAEAERLAQDARRERNWKRWGPYLAERQWGTVREDYSADGNCWDYFPHDHARSRAYRWGEDGLLGITDRQGRLCFALALWNGGDPILKERLFGLTGPEGNHGEDVKELYYYLDSTPTHSYMKALYKYPQARVSLRAAGRGRTGERGSSEPEFELLDTGVFDDDRYFDVFAEYAKAAPDDILIRITVANRGPEAATLHLLPTLWFRNTWSWGRDRRGLLAAQAVDPRATARTDRGRARGARPLPARCRSPSTARRPRCSSPRTRPTTSALFGAPNPHALRQGRVPRAVIEGETGGGQSRARWAPRRPPHYRAHGAGGRRARSCGSGSRDGERRRARRLRRRVRARSSPHRIAEADAFYAERIPAAATDDERRVLRQAYAGLLWTQAVLPLRRARTGSTATRRSRRPRRRAASGRNARVAAPLQPRRHLDAGQVGVPLVRRLGPGLPHDPVRRSRSRLRQGAAPAPAARVVHAPERPAPGLRVRLRRREPAGARLGLLAGLQDDRRQGPARPPVPRARLPEAAAQLHLVGEPQGPRGTQPLRRAASSGSTTSASSTARRPLPTGGHLEQADGTAWMAFYCTTMLSMALELASEDPAYEDMASKFFEHFVAIADAMNNLGGTGPVGRGGRLLLRPAPRRRRAHAAARPLAGRR